MVISVSHVTDLLTERRLRDEVALTAAIDIYASSTSPTGGRVDFYVVLHNDGSRRVQIARLAAEAGGLRLRSAGVLPQVLDGGSAVRVPLSVRLDCTRERLDVLRAAVSASPGSGRRRAVTVTLGASQLITDIADSLCSVKPELADQELSGPLRAAQAGDHPR